MWTCKCPLCFGSEQRGRGKTIAPKKKRSETMYQTTKFSAASSLMPQRPGGQAGEPWAATPAGAGGPSFSAGSPGVSGGTAAAAKQRLRWTPELHERDRKSVV